MLGTDRLPKGDVAHRIARLAARHSRTTRSCFTCNRMSHRCRLIGLGVTVVAYAFTGAGSWPLPLMTAAGASPATPQSRLYDVWLDLQLVAIFYPTTTARSLPGNLHRVARQLNQPPIPIFFGEQPSDALRFPPIAVVIKRHPPKRTLVLYARTGAVVWSLVDDPKGHLTLSRLGRQ